MQVWSLKEFFHLFANVENLFSSCNSNSSCNLRATQTKLFLLRYANKVSSFLFFIFSRIDDDDRPLTVLCYVFHYWQIDRKINRLLPPSFFSPEVIFDLDTFDDKSKIEEAVKNVPYPSYRTFTGKAMTAALKHFTPKMRMDRNVLKVCTSSWLSDESKFLGENRKRVWEREKEKKQR